MIVPVLIKKNVSYYKRWPRHLYRCVCGNEFEARAAAIKSGNTKSCGCLRKQLIVERNKSKEQRAACTTHGLSRTRTYKIWVGMIQRTTNPKQSHYSYYGGRGISVCPSWLYSFERFLADMGEAPANLTLERIDNDIGYEPSNCKWATRAEQVANRRPYKKRVI